MPNGDLHVHFRRADVAETVRFVIIVFAQNMNLNFAGVRCVEYEPKFTSLGLVVCSSLGTLATNDE